MTRNPRAGLTLIEVLIAVSLVGLLSVGMLWAIRVGVNAMGKSNEKLISNRRVTGFAARPRTANRRLHARSSRCPHRSRPPRREGPVLPR